MRERCGEVYSAVRNPAAAQMLASVAAVLPLPLVRDQDRGKLFLRIAQRSRQHAHLRQVELPPRSRWSKLQTEAMQMVEGCDVGHIAILDGMEDPVAMRTIPLFSIFNNVPRVA